jgi:hypothetical protein
MPLTTMIEAEIYTILTGSTAAAGVTPTAPSDVLTRQSWQTGVGSNQADKVYTATRTVAASGTDALDLAGVLTDPLGSALTFVKMKALLVRAAAANTNNVRLNRPATNGVPLFVAVSSGIDILPGGLFLWTAPGAGVTVTPATGDIINLDNSGAGTSVTYDIVIVGTSA